MELKKGCPPRKAAAKEAHVLLRGLIELPVHYEVPGGFILSICRVAAHAFRHLFQFLTMRAKRMADLFDEYRHIICEDHMHGLPPSNVQLGVSFDNQCFAELVL